MAQNEENSNDPNRGFLTWFLFCVQILALIFLALFGFVVADADRAAGDYAAGLTLSVSAILLCFFFLKQAFDGGNSLWGGVLFAETTRGLAAAIPVLTVLGLLGLFLAHAAKGGSLYGAGLALFVVSALSVFLNIKHVYDHRDRSRD